tara:strand:- start:1367 stop:2380 length:1014 start_codon:yes stop_codon:yes gene_type:complete
MAVVRPLIVNEPSGDLRSMSEAQVQQLIDEVIRLYAIDPAIELSVTSAPDDGTIYQYKLSTLTDTRFQASSVATAGFPWPTPDVPSHKLIGYNETLLDMKWKYTFPYKDRAGSIYAGHSYPIYYSDSQNKLQAASLLDMVDTFIRPALQSISGNTLTPEAAGGSYFISTNTSESSATLVSSNPIYKDTISDIAAFASGNLPEDVDQPLNSATIDYFLHKIEAPNPGFFVQPATILDDGSVKVIPREYFRAMMTHLIQYMTSLGSTTYGVALRYQYGTATFLSSQNMNTRGTGMTDTYTSSYTQRYEQPYGGNTYYSQNVPTGTPAVQTTRYLGVGLA